MKKLIRVLSLVGVFYVFGGCKAADPATPPVAASYLGKWGNDRDMCGGPDQTLQREATVTFNTDKTVVFSSYDCDDKARRSAYFSYTLVDNILKMVWIKTDNSDGKPLILTEAQKQEVLAQRFTVTVNAAGNKLLFSPGLGSDSPALRDFIKR